MLVPAGAAVGAEPSGPALVLALGAAAVALLALLALLGWALARRRGVPLRGPRRRDAPMPGWIPGREPYPGLAPFGELDAAVFAGRDREIAALLARFDPPAARPERRFVPVVGPAGCGKSSLVHAGLVPQLRAGHGWLVLPLGVQADDPALSWETGAVRREAGTAAAPVLVLIDPADPVLDLAEPGRDAFVAGLRDALERDPRLWIVATLRSDALDRLLATANGDLFREPFAIGPPDRAGLAEAVERPAQLAGMRVAPDVVERLVGEAGTPDGLPLLAHALRWLYREVGPGGEADAAACQRLGGLALGLARRADGVADALAAGLGPPGAPAALLRFAAVDESGFRARGVRRTELSATERQVADAFRRAGLLLGGDGEDAVLWPAEVLLRRWPPLRQEIDVRVEELRRRAVLARWSREWSAAGRRASYLLSGERLRTAREWSASLGDGLSELPHVTELLLQSGRLDRDAMQRLSETIAERAISIVEHDPEQSLLLALAVIEECAATPAAHRALLAAVASRGLSVRRVPESRIERVAWSPDGCRLAATCHDGTVRIWDVERGGEVDVMRGHDGPVLAVAWSPGGERVATGSEDGTARVWDAAKRGQVVVLSGHEGAVRDVAWSPDGRLLATASTGGPPAVWDAMDGSRLLTLRGHRNAVGAVAWSPGGDRLATASVDRSVRLWDSGNGATVAVLRGHDEAVESVAWSPDGGRLATASADGTVRVWDAGVGQERVVLTGHDAWVLDATWSPDGRRLATASADRTAAVWDAASGARLAVLRGHEDEVRTVAWSPDGSRIATASWDQTVRTWEAGPGLELRVCVGHREAAWQVAWSPDGRRLATASTDHTARVWNAEAGDEQLVLRGHGDEVRGVAWSPDGRRLATASWDRTVRTWGAEGAAQQQLRLRAPVHHVAWSPDGKCLAAAADENVVWVWDAEVGTRLLDLRGHEEAVLDVAWSPEGRRLATASRDQTVRIWDVEGGAQLALLRGHRGRVSNVGWSPDGRRLATASWDQTARIWDAVEGRELALVRGHEGPVNALAWSPDGRRIATVSDDRTLRLWDAGRGTELPLLCVHVAAVASVAWSPAGDRLASASLNGTAQTWDAAGRLEALVARARRRVTRALTVAERRSAGLSTGDAGGVGEAGLPGEPPPP